MTPIVAYLDRGLLGDRVRARAGQGPPTMGTIAAAAAAPLSVVADTSSVMLVAAVVWFAAIATAAPERGRLGWFVPPALRAAEYATVLAVVLDDRSGAAWGYAYLAALAFHHYDIVYRLRQLGSAPPQWVRAAVLGAELRTPLLLALLVAGVDTTTPMAVASCWIAVVCVAESTHVWRRAADGAAQAGRPT